MKRQQRVLLHHPALLVGRTCRSRHERTVNSTPQHKILSYFAHTGRYSTERFVHDTSRAWMSLASFAMDFSNRLCSTNCSLMAPWAEQNVRRWLPHRPDTGIDNRSARQVHGFVNANKRRCVSGNPTPTKRQRNAVLAHNLNLTVSLPPQTCLPPLTADNNGKCTLAEPSPKYKPHGNALPVAARWWPNAVPLPKREEGKTKHPLCSKRFTFSSLPAGLPSFSSNSLSHTLISPFTYRGGVRTWASASGGTATRESRRTVIPRRRVP